MSSRPNMKSAGALFVVSLALASALAPRGRTRSGKILQRSKYDPEAEWLWFKNKYNKIYASPEEEAYRKKVFEVDTFAYSQQNFPGSDLFSGYCAEGVVPRGDGGCKLKPSIEKGQWITLLKEAAALYEAMVQDELLEMIDDVEEQMDDDYEDFEEDDDDAEGTIEVLSARRSARQMGKRRKSGTIWGKAKSGAQRDPHAQRGHVPSTDP